MTPPSAGRLPTLIVHQVPRPRRGAPHAHRPRRRARTAPTAGSRPPTRWCEHRRPRLRARCARRKVRPRTQRSRARPRRGRATSRRSGRRRPAASAPAAERPATPGMRPTRACPRRSVPVARPAVPGSRGWRHDIDARACPGNGRMVCTDANLPCRAGLARAHTPLTSSPVNHGTRSRKCTARSERIPPSSGSCRDARPCARPASSPTESPRAGRPESLRRCARARVRTGARSGTGRNPRSTRSALRASCTSSLPCTASSASGSSHSTASRPRAHPAPARSAMNWGCRCRRRRCRGRASIRRSLNARASTRISRRIRAGIPDCA